MKSEKETLVDSIFPKEGSLKKMSNRKKLKAWAQASPFLALLAMLLMMWGFGPIGIIIGLLCGGSLIGIIITSVIMKKNGRDPSALLVGPIPSNPEKRQDLKNFSSSLCYNLFYIRFLQKTAIKQIF